MDRHADRLNGGINSAALATHTTLLLPPQLHNVSAANPAGQHGIDTPHPRVGIRLHHLHLNTVEERANDPRFGVGLDIHRGNLCRHDQPRIRSNAACHRHTSGNTKLSEEGAARHVTADDYAGRLT